MRAVEPNSSKAHVRYIGKVVQLHSQLSDLLRQIGRLVLTPQYVLTRKGESTKGNHGRLPPEEVAVRGAKVKARERK